MKHLTEVSPGCHAVQPKGSYVSPTIAPRSALTDVKSRDKTIELGMETMRHAEGRPQAKRVFRFRIRSRERGRVNLKTHLSLVFLLSRYLH